MIKKFAFNNQYILNELPETERAFLKEAMKSKKYRKNQAVFSEGSIPSGVFYINEGKAKKFKLDSEGREQIIYIYTAGEFFGYSSLLSEEPYGDSVSVIEDANISFVPKANFMDLIDSSSTFSRLLLKSLSHEFSVMANFMAVLSQRTVRERVALSLLILHDKYKTIGNEEISISRLDFSNMVGTVIETLARILHDFKDEGLITTEGRIIRIEKQDELIKISNFY